MKLKMAMPMRTRMSSRRSMMLAIGFLVLPVATVTDLGIYDFVDTHSNAGLLLNSNRSSLFVRGLKISRMF